jgi:MFS family permease
MMQQKTKNALLTREFQLSFWSFFFLWISFDFFILFPLFILDRGGNSVDVGIQTAIFFFPSVIMRPIAGRLTDRTGRLKTLWIGTLFMILSSLLFLLLRGSYEEIKIWCAITLLLRGLGFAAFYTAFFTYVADLSTPQNRARLIGLFGVSGLVAHGLAPRIAEIVLTRYHFTGYFLGCAILASISLVISLFLREQERPIAPHSEGFRSFLEVTFTKRNLIVLPGSFIFGFAIASFNTFGAPYFKAIGYGSVGYFFLSYGLTAGFVRIFLGGIADRYPRWILVGIFFLVQAVGLFLITAGSAGFLYLIAASICGVAHGILFPTMTAMAVDAHPEEHRGLATSVFTGTMELGFSIGSYLLGIVVSTGGFVAMFLTAFALALLFCIYTFLIRRFMTGNRGY